MMPDGVEKQSRRSKQGLLRRLFRRRDGATAIEFALLSLPFFMVVFASIETFVALTGEQVLAAATDAIGRKIRTGEITFKQGKPTDVKNEEEFRALFCQEIAIMLTCSATETMAPSKLFLDVRSFEKFSDIPNAVPRIGGDLDTSAFKFAPGGKKTINIVRAYYRWEILTDLVRPYITNIRPANGARPTYLMVATAVVQNEDYP